MIRPVCFECGKPATGKYCGPCSVCAAPTCPKHTYFYVDHTNWAITASARPKCKAHKGSGA